MPNTLQRCRRSPASLQCVRVTLSPMSERYGLNVAAVAARLNDVSHGCGVDMEFQRALILFTVLVQISKKGGTRF